ncbi:hypothetical protein BC938DRAFT_476448 [Jimgerdemannia flammicorona]|uniref:Uncharacterized protein n=1 Tax=Jimgerdemannia flammicorona TaxID=994334 RepID=A0A433PH40_9FUNG|nr:hypothetical protein BC938DRAFT_476448 [Jimgerdemannia flammicorona]
MHLSYLRLPHMPLLSIVWYWIIMIFYGEDEDMLSSSSHETPNSRPRSNTIVKYLSNMEFTINESSVLMNPEEFVSLRAELSTSCFLIEQHSKPSGQGNI